MLSATTPARPVDSLVDQGRAALARGELVAARSLLNSAWAAGLTEPLEGQVRAELIGIADQTIFSGRFLPGDELVDRYVIRTGDNLARIANQYAVTADLIAAINGIPDKNRIREGQVVKVLQGPFHAVVHKRAYRMDVFLGQVLVRSYPVGLGLDDSTPTGEWKVRNKLENPTYYPPRGGAIIAADDPENPLGERWIGLEGVSGEALSQQRYGIHGTNEPESIGRSISLGCVRLHNPDVEMVYTFLIEGKSTVTILE
jgi:lipoprotein-anchoring transpeptidase ErfK/SrfK